MLIKQIRIFLVHNDSIYLQSIFHQFKMQELDPEIDSKIEQLFTHEIKAKRVKKQISQLAKLELDNVVLNQVTFSPIGLRIPVQFHKKNKQHKFEIRVDVDYPFNRPQVHYLEKLPYASEARDLIQYQLGNNEIWGPAMMLHKFIEGIPFLVDRIEKNGQQLMGTYYQNDYYEQQQLIRKGLKIFEVKELSWRYMIKKTSSKILAISNLVFLKFTAQNNKLKLDLWIPVKQIREVASNLQLKTLNIKWISKKSSKQQIIYLTDLKNLEQILLHLNPTQMIERRVKQLEQDQQVTQQLIKDYGYLIQYYSLRNVQQSNLFLEKMKGAIKKQYNTEQVKI